MITIKESQTIEFEQLWKDEYLKTICAFANSDGGDSYIGIADDSTAVGIDDIVGKEFTIDEIDLNTIEKFKSWAKKRIPSIEQERDLHILLEKLNLYDGKYLKRAAVLLFGKNPQKYFIQSHSKIGKFISDSELLTSDIIEGNLFQQLEQIIDILRTKYLHSFISYEGINRVETLEYPYEAVREAIINALIHRDYTDTTVLQIRVYDEKIVFSNGATLSTEVPIEKFKEDHISKPFNPLIANIFYKAGFVESWGKGTNSMMQECLKMHMPEPQYAYSFQAVQVTFYKTTRDKIISLLQEHPKYTKQDLMTILNKGDATIKEHLAKLKKEGLLKRVGSTKLGYWELVDKEDIL